MASRKLCAVFLLFSVICPSWQLRSRNQDIGLRNNVPIRMEQKIESFANEDVAQKSFTDSHRKKRSLTEDSTCQLQENTLKESIPSDFVHVHFFNETKANLALIWVKNVVIIAVTEEERNFLDVTVKPSTLYRSDNEGKMFTDITDKVHPGGDIKIKTQYGLQQKGDTFYLVLHGDNSQQTTLKFSDNAGESFRTGSMPFTFVGELVFHPSKPTHILALDKTNLVLYKSTDYGMTWRLIQKNVLSFKWSTLEGETDTIYVTQDPDMQRVYVYMVESGINVLLKSPDAGVTWRTVHEDILSFGIQGKFMYASVRAALEGHRYMEVSTDGGESWNEVQLPTIDEDRFYSILDMSEEQIFMHVDDPGDTGVGTVYTSDSTGIIFSESLTNHLFPNYEDVTDFYKVNSMRGVYIGSQLNSDTSVHSVITIDRGGEWNRIRRPDGIPCVDENKECYMQIHNKYSAQRGVDVAQPLSMESAIGIILVHGHVASALQMSEPDVYVSDDGGYSWRLSLEGPHDYQIADQGGLLVALPHASYPKVIKFSTDEGNCWHEYQFTNDDLRVTGLLTEPGNSAMTVALYAYGMEDKQWRVYVIDFEKIIPNKCTDTDYVEWKAHSDNNNDGCLLGKKETFQRLKPDAWCLNGHARQIMNPLTSQVCDCTKQDYDCDYGYMRELGSDQCVFDPAFKEKTLDICKQGHLEQLVYVGYHKIPGDVCSGGFTPASDFVIDLKTKCAEGDKSFIKVEEGIETKEVMTETKRGRVILVLSMLSVLFILVALVIFLVRKHKILRRSKLVYRYSMINSDDANTDDLENALGTSNSLYEDSSDEDISRDPRNRSGASLDNKSPRASLNHTSPPASLNHTSPPASLDNTSPRATQPMGSLSQPRQATAQLPKPSTLQSQVPQIKKPEVKSYHDDSDEDMLE